MLANLYWWFLSIAQLTEHEMTHMLKAKECCDPCLNLTFSLNNRKQSIACTLLIYPRHVRHRRSTQTMN